jgi:YD repeat-containing protein
MKLIIFVFSFLLSVSSLFAQSSSVPSIWTVVKPYENYSDEKSERVVDNLEQKKLGEIQPTRFLSVDPMADKYPRMNPYHYTLNNPIRYIDPTGMWVASYDSSGNIVSVDYEDGDTYEDLYSQLGITAEEFSEKYGIDLSAGITTTTFDITSFVFKNSNFSNDNSMMNCFSSCLTGTGAMSVETSILGGFNFTESVQQLFGYKETNNSTTGTMTTWTDSEGVTHHSAINVITSQSGTQYYVGRPGPNSNISLQNSNVTNQLYPGHTRTVLIYPFKKPKPGF